MDNIYIHPSRKVKDFSFIIRNVWEENSITYNPLISLQFLKASSSAYKLSIIYTLLLN